MADNHGKRDLRRAPKGKGASQGKPNAGPSKPRQRPPKRDTSWERVAPWYARLIGEGKSDHYAELILPGALRLLEPRKGQRILDVACGEGILCRTLAEKGAETVGVDASTALIEAAQHHRAPKHITPPVYHVGDARTLDTNTLGPFDAIACIMALMNIDPLQSAVRSCAACLKPGGRFVAIILHPAFRSPKQTSWGWRPAGEAPEAAALGESHGDHVDPRSGDVRQFRRVDAYLSPNSHEILANPGEAAHGKKKYTTWTFHRPIQAYINTFTAAGLLIDRLEEWPSKRQSQPGPRAKEENRIRKEIPMFLAIRGIKGNAESPFIPHILGQPIDRNQLDRRPQP